jgi:hypothetical protein
VASNGCHALLAAGRRGVTMVQQWVGWDDENTGPQREHVAQPVVGPLHDRCRTLFWKVAISLSCMY